MEKNKVLPDNQKEPQTKRLNLTTEEKKKLVDFFSVLIKIDRRTNTTEVYDKPIN